MPGPDSASDQRKSNRCVETWVVMLFAYREKKMFRLLLYQNFSYNPTMRSLHADHAALPPVFEIPLLRVCCRSGGLLRDVARLSLDVNRGSLPPVAEILIRKNTLSRWQACQGYGIISAERLQRGRFSLIAHPAGRPGERARSAHRRRGIMSAEHYKRGHFSSIAHPAQAEVTTHARFAHRRCGIMSAEHYKRGHFSLINHQAGRPEGAGAIYVQA